MQIDVDVVVLVACGCGCENGHSPALAGRDALAEETLIVSLSGFMRQTQAPILIDLDVCCTHIKKVWGCGLCLCVILRIFTRATAEQRDIQNFNTMWSAVCVDTHTHLCKTVVAGSVYELLFWWTNNLLESVPPKSQKYLNSNYILVPSFQNLSFLVLKFSSN